MSEGNAGTDGTGSIRLGTPRVVSQGPPDVKGWGPWQFPHIERLADGRIHVSYHVEADSARAYGKPRQHAVSSDGGVSWEHLDAAPSGGGLLTSDGSRISSFALRSVPAEDMDLGSPVGTLVNYGHEVRYYPAERVAAPHRGWFVARNSADDRTGVPEPTEVRIPGEVRVVVEGVLSRPFFYLFRPGPGGSIWAPHYFTRIDGGKLLPTWSAAFLRSSDDGRSWDLASEIRYDPDYLSRLGCDPLADRRIGFSEPDLVFLDDNRSIALLRTTDGNGVGPSYLSVSRDSARTWSPPVCFDRLGVLPQLALLADGSVLAAYGRPGLFLRHLPAQAVRDDRLEPEHWGDPVPVVKPGTLQTETCSYPSLLVNDDGTALLAYSDFTVKDTDGKPCKTILVRTVEPV